jgi:hypothetical protein
MSHQLNYKISGDIYENNPPLIPMLRSPYFIDNLPSNSEEIPPRFELRDFSPEPPENLHIPQPRPIQRLPQYRPQPQPQQNKPTTTLEYKTLSYANSGNPEVWGPAFWFSLHNGALRYPKQASPIWKERMKHFIMGIPVMVPCEKCADHATAHLEDNWSNMDNIVSGRDNLFKFFWEFHNFVNQRLGKPQMSLEDAYKLYGGNIKVTKLVITQE